VPGGAVIFGKLPAHGDFVARGLAAWQRERLDQWLSASLADARDQLGDAFAERFDTAPPWRCVGARAGAIAPSQDGAGRRFPLLLMAGSGRAGAQACEALLYDAIGGGWDADRVLAEAERIVAEEPAGATTWETDGGEGFAPATLPGEHPAGLVAAMLGAGA
jgi:type VI secretion system ImpM family protein